MGTHVEMIQYFLGVALACNEEIQESQPMAGFFLFLVNTTYN
jgi:hypothetical protein